MRIEGAQNAPWVYKECVVVAQCLHAYRKLCSECIVNAKYVCPKCEQSVLDAHGTCTGIMHMVCSRCTASVD